MRVDWITCGHCNFKRLAWCFCIVLVDSRSSRSQSDGRLSKGSLVIITSAKMSKCVNNRKMHRLSYEHTLAWLDAEMTKPFLYTCSTWLTDGVSDKRDTHDWLFIHWDDACVIVNVTLCVSATDAFIANITRTYETKTLSITRTRSQAWLRHQHAETWMQWTSKADVKTHTS